MSSSLISSHPSTSGLQIALHPLALLTISDYITRHKLRHNEGPIIGALLGRQDGREISIEHAYEIVVIPGEADSITIETEWFAQKLKLFKETHTELDLYGWFTTTSSPTFEPTPVVAAIHQQLLTYNESLVVLLFNPGPAAMKGEGSGKLPLTVFESIYDADEKTQELKLKFVPLKYTIETGEAEMIGVDFVAKGAGNAAGEESGVSEKEKAPKKSAKASTASPSSKQSGEDSKGKGKEKEAEGPENVELGAQNEELLANLTTKRNAIIMLQSRLRLLLAYLQETPSEAQSHQINRAIWALTNSRLPLATPPNVEAFKEEKLAEEADVSLAVLLGTLTKSLEEMQKVGKKYSAIEGSKKSGKGMELNWASSGGMELPRELRMRREGFGSF